RSWSYRGALAKELQRALARGPDVAGAEDEHEVARQRALRDDPCRCLGVGRVEGTRTLGERARAAALVRRLPRRLERLDDQAVVRRPERRGEIVEERAKAARRVRLEDHHEPASRAWPHGRDRGADLARMMGVVIDDGHT